MLKIAIDGPAASGKGTIAVRVAARYGLRHLDTGLLYRAVAARCSDTDTPHNDVDRAAAIAADLAPDDLKRDDLRTAEVGVAASVVAAHGPVRAALVEWQRAFAAEAPGAVLDGRDIGTVILPDADVKLFVTADVDVRAARRWRELSKTSDIAYRNVLSDIEARDARDSGRADAPMLKAEDADLLDTTEMSVEQALNIAIELIERRMRNRK